MRIIDEITNQEIADPDLTIGELHETTWAGPEAYASIDNVTKFALDESDYETVQLYHAYTADEIAARARAAEEAAYVESRHGVTDEWLMREIAKAVTVPEPPARKDGFITVPHYDHAGNSIVWTFEPDPDYIPTADGSYLHPYAFVAPMEVKVGKWYTNGDDIWECVESGTADVFDAPWFDVL